MSQGDKFIYFTHPKKGEFRLLKRNGDTFVPQKNLNGRWGEEFTSNYQIPQWLKNDHVLWMIEEEAILTKEYGKVRGIITDIQTQKPIYELLTNGRIKKIDQVPGQPAIYFDYLDTSSGISHGFEKFDEKHNIIVKRNEEGAIKGISFIRYQSQDHHPLDFSRAQNGDLVWSGNREFRLPPGMKQSLLGTIDNYIYLDNGKTGPLLKEKLLVPFQKIVRKREPIANGNLEIQNGKRLIPPLPGQEYNELFATQKHLEFDVVNQKVIPISLESQLFLAYIRYSQMEYREAIRLITSLKAVERISPIGMKILEMIQALPPGVDHPDAHMVKMHAWAVYTEEKDLCAVDPVERYFPEIDDSPTVMAHIQSTLKILQSSSNISVECQMPESQLMKLIEKMIRECTQMQSTAAALESLKTRYAFIREKENQDRIVLASTARLSSLDSEFIFTTERIRDRPESDRAGRDCVKNLRWLKQGFNSSINFDTEILYTNSYNYFQFEDGAVFLHVCKLAECGSKTEKLDMIHRIHLSNASLKGCGQRSLYMDYMLFILSNPWDAALPSVSTIGSHSSDEDLYAFLKGINDQYKKWRNSKNADLNHVLQLDLKSPHPHTKESASIPSITLPWTRSLLETSSVDRGDKQPIPYSLNRQQQLTDNTERWEELQALKQHIGDHQYLKSFIEHKMTAIRAQHKHLEKSLLLKANKRSSDPIERQIEESMILGKRFSQMTFQDCVDCLLTNDIQTYKMKNGNLTATEISQIVIDTLRLLDMQSYIGQLERMHILLENYGEKSPSEQLMHDEQLTVLLHGRYDFSELSPAAQAALHVFVGNTGIIPFEAQMELIKKMMDGGDEIVNDKVIQLMMGGGKTSVIATILLYMRAMSGSSVSCFIVPYALMQVGKLNLSDFFRQAFGKELLEMDMRRSNFTIYGLQKELSKLRKAVENHQPLMISASTIQGLWMEKSSLMRRLPKLFAKVDATGVRSIEVQSEIDSISQKIELIIEILGIPKDGILDEIDVSLHDKIETNFIDGEQCHVDKASNDLLMTIFQKLTSDALQVKVGNPLQHFTYSIIDFVKLRTNHQSDMKQEEFRENVVPVVAQSLLSDSGFQKFKEIPVQFHHSFIRYVSDQIPSAVQNGVNSGNIPILSPLLTWSLDGVEKMKYSAEEAQKDGEFLNYLKTIYKNGENKKLADFVALTRYFLSSILPHTMSKNSNRHYGLLKIDPKESQGAAQKEMKMIPYVGTNTPGTTEFGNPWEAAAYYYQQALFEKPTREMILNVAEITKETALKFVEERGELFYQTAEYQFFLDSFGVNLDEISANTPELLDIARNHVFEKPELLLALTQIIINREVTYSADYLSSNGFDLTRLLKSRQGMSGTPIGRQGWLESLARKENFIPDAEFEEKLKNELQKRNADPQNIIEVDLSAKKGGKELIPATITDFIEQIHKKYCRETSPNRANRFKRLRAFIDTAGTFTSFGSHQDFAGSWLKFIIAKQEEEKSLPDDLKTVDPNIEAALFFHQGPGESQPNTLHAWKKGESGELELIYIGGTSVAALGKKGLSPNKYVTLYDEAHGTGVDIQQASDGIAIQTFGNQPMRDVLQSMMRMRRYLKNTPPYQTGQDVDFVIEKEMRNNMLQKGATIEALIANAEKIQDNRRLESMERYFNQNINSLFKKYASDLLDRLFLDFYQSKSLEKESEAAFSRKIKALEEFLVTTMKEDPYRMHGEIQGMVETKEVLISRLKEKFARFLATSEMTSNDPLLLSITSEAQALEKWIHIQDKGVLPEYTLANAPSIGVFVQQEIAREVAVNIENQKELQQELQVELEQYASISTSHHREETPLDYRNFVHLISGLKEGTPIAGVQLLTDEMKQFDYKFSYDKAFTASIYGTDNYFKPYQDVSLPIFHPLHRPAKQIVAIKIESGQYKWLLLSEHEAGQVKDHLSRLQKENVELAKNIWFIDPNGVDFVKAPAVTRISANKEIEWGAFHPLDDQALIGLIEINAILGNMSFISRQEYQRETEEWLSTDTLIKTRLLALTSYSDPRQWRIYQRSSLIAEALDEFSEKNNPLFMCKERELREANLQGIIDPASPIETKCITRKYAIAHLKVDHVKDLCIDVTSQNIIDLEAMKHLKLKTPEAVDKHNRKQLKWIQKYHGPYITPEQIKWLPVEKICYLTPEQIKWLPVEKIRYLTRADQFQDVSKGEGEGKYLLTLEQVKGMVEEQKEFIGMVNPDFYKSFDQPWQIQAIPPSEQKAIDDIPMRKYVHLTRAQLANEKKWFLPYVLSCLAIGLFTLLASLFHQISRIWTSERSQKQFKAKHITPHTERLAHLVNTYAPAVFYGKG